MTDDRLRQWFTRTRSGSYRLELVPITGDIAVAAFLSEILFWWMTPNPETGRMYGVERDGRRWLYNSQEDWAQQLGLLDEQGRGRRRVIQRMLTTLEAQGWIVTATAQRADGAPVCHVSVNDAALEACLGLHQGMQSIAPEGADQADPATPAPAPNGAMRPADVHQPVQSTAPNGAMHCTPAVQSSMETSEPTTGTYTKEGESEYEREGRSPTGQVVQGVIPAISAPAGAAPAADQKLAARKPRRPRASSPLGPGALVYRDECRLTPNNVQREGLDWVVEQCGEENLRRACRQWMARGYNPRNVEAIVDVVLHGWRSAPADSGLPRGATRRPDGELDVSYDRPNGGQLPRKGRRMPDGTLMVDYGNYGGG